jgi:peptidoglycan/LPS O-acetylase OafA/YrhL
MQPRQRLDHVHGLRGIAALVVVLQHAFQMVQDAGVRYFEPLLMSINLGRFGVVLFFLISGLVIPFSIRGPDPLRGFAIGRFFRLYPAYWLSIPVLAVVWTAKGHPPNLTMIAANVTMLQGFWGIPDIGPGYWTLKFEVIFYVLCAVLCWRKLLDDVAFNAFAALACLVLALLPAALNAGDVLDTPFFVGMFLMGMLLRRGALGEKTPWTTYALVLLSAATGVVMGGVVSPVPANGNFYFAPLALATGMALPVLVFAWILWRKPTPPRALMYLGTISYSLYLFQDIGLHLLPFVIAPGRWPITYVLAVVGLSLVIAVIVERWLERPMIAVGRRIIAGGREARVSRIPA